MKSAASQPENPTLFRDKNVFVQQLLPLSRARLVTISDKAPLHEAARLLCAGTDLVIVCGENGAMVGVITKTDVVARIGECQGAACTTAAALVMSTEVLQCAPGDLVHEVWAKMKSRNLKNIPIADADGQPVGVLNARDALGVLLQEVKIEESLLRDYVMGVDTTDRSDQRRILGIRSIKAAELMAVLVVDVRVMRMSMVDGGMPVQVRMRRIAIPGKGVRVLVVRIMHM